MKNQTILRWDDFTTEERLELVALNELFSSTASQLKYVDSINKEDRAPISNHIKAFFEILELRKDAIEQNARRKLAFRKAGM